MATLSAADAEIAFRSDAAFGATVSATQTEFVWDTTGGARIRATGTNFTYSGGRPTGGTVTRIEFDYTDVAHPLGTIDAVLTDLSVPLANLVDPSNPEAGQIRFWETVLPGNDRITAPSIGDSAVFGDFTNVISPVQDTIQRTGGNDVITANVTVPQEEARRVGGLSALVGDALYVAGAAENNIAYPATLIGGDDTIGVSGYSGYLVVGDVSEVATLGEVIGGDDVLRSDVARFSPSAVSILVGDVDSSTGFVVGGADQLTGTDFAFIDEQLTGDVRIHQSDQVRGGADLLLGRAGQDRVAGDVFTQGGGFLTGGADVVRGGEESDILSGDVFTFARTRAVVGGGDPPILVDLDGGDDRLFGDAGNDWIVGDAWSARNVDGASTIEGGDDLVTGGAGDDMLFGDVDAAMADLLDAGGDDILDGGLGDDLIDGQLGSDTASFASEAAAVVVDLLAGTATGQGADTLASIENVLGSGLADTLRGSEAVNRLMGGSGNDTLTGRGGADRLEGGAGNDRLNGGHLADVFVGGAGADIFIFGQNGTGFTTSATNERVLDFQNGADKLDLTAFGFASFGEVRALTASTASGIRIDLPGVEVVFVSGLALAQFNASDVVLT